LPTAAFVDIFIWQFQLSFLPLYQILTLYTPSLFSREGAIGGRVNSLFFKHACKGTSVDLAIGGRVKEGGERLNIHGDLGD